MKAVGKGVTEARLFNLSTADGSCDGESELAKSECKFVGPIVGTIVNVNVVGLYEGISVRLVVVGKFVSPRVGLLVGGLLLWFVFGRRVSVKSNENSGAGVRKSEVL